MKWRILAILLMLTLLAGGGWLLLTKLKPPVRGWKLASGETVSFVKLTSGSHPPLDYGGGWRDVAGQMLPPKIAAKLGITGFRYPPAGSNTVVAWFRQDGLPPGTRGRPLSGIGWAVVVMDDKGLEQSYRFPTIQKKGNVWGYVIRNFPHRTRELRLQVGVFRNETGSFLRLGELTVPNPEPSRAVAWSPETLPAIHETNGLSVTLMQLETGLTDEEDYSTSEPNSISRVLFDLRENGSRAQNWSLVSMMARAPTGEESLVDRGGWRWTTQGLRYTFEAPLWTEEPAWEVIAKFRRSSGYRPEETWTIRGVRVPKPGEVVEIGVRTNVSGAEIEFVGVCGRGAATNSVSWTIPSEERTTMWWTRAPRDQTTVYTEVNHLPSGTSLELVSITDEHGNEIPCHPNWQSSAPSTTEYYFPIQPATNSTSLDITFALPTSRVVTFRAKPTPAK